MPHMNNFAGRPACLAAMIGMVVCVPVWAQTTVSVNVDYAEGKYGEEEKSTSWTVPLIIKHQMGDFGIKLYMPYVRATGTAISGGDRFLLTKQTQEGFGDLVATLSYDVVGNTTSGLLIGIGAKSKFATADKSNDLLTTGKNDYSLMVDALLPVGDTLAFAIVGRTKKGDPEGIDYRDPWFSTIGLSYTLSGSTKLGGIYDYRQKVTSTGDPVSEAMLYLERMFAERYKVQAYLVRGYSDASADQGAGVTISTSF